MVPLIEDQIHQYLIEREDQRCVTLEAENALREETKGKVVKRRKIAKPWKRGGRISLLQDTDLLLMIREYDYDLLNKDFQNYSSSRGVLQTAGQVESKKWKFCVDHSKTKNDYLADPAFHYAQEMDGKRYKYTDNEMETGWKIIVIGRAKLQDCWEIYTGRFSDSQN
jgi:hypothetical protein